MKKISFCLLFAMFCLHASENSSIDLSFSEGEPTRKELQNQIKELKRLNHKISASKYCYQAWSEVALVMTPLIGTITLGVGGLDMENSSSVALFSLSVTYGLCFTPYLYYGVKSIYKKCTHSDEQEGYEEL